MLALKVLKSSDSKQTAMCIKYKGVPHIAALKSNHLSIYTENMDLVKKIPIYGILTHIIPLEESFVCIGPYFSLNVGESIKKTKLKKSINSNCIINSTKFCLIKDKRIILAHKTRSGLIIDESVNDLAFLHIFDVDVKDELIYVLYGDLDGVKKGSIYNQQIGLFKYVGNKIIFVENICFEGNAYKIIAWKKILIVIEHKSINIVSCDSFINHRDVNKHIMMNLNPICDLNKQCIINHFVDDDYCMLICQNSEILVLRENLQVISFGFLPYSAKNITKITKNKFLAFGPDFYFLIQINFCDIANFNSRTCDDLFVNPRIRILTEEKTTDYMGNVYFNNGNLILTKNTERNLNFKFSNSYVLEKQLIASYSDKIRNLCVFDEMMFVSFVKSYVVYNLKLSKEIYQSSESIQNFHGGILNSSYLLNTRKTLKSVKNIYTFDFLALLTSSYNNKILIYCKRLDGFFLLLCEGEVITAEIQVECDISMIVLDERIFISRFDDTFSIMNYNFKVEEIMNIPCLMYSLKMNGKTKIFIFCTEDGHLYKYDGKFTPLYFFNQQIKQISCYFNSKLVVLGDFGYVIDIDKAVDSLHIKLLDGNIDYLNVADGVIYFAWHKNVYSSNLSKESKLEISVFESTDPVVKIIYSFHRNDEIRFYQLVNESPDNTASSLTTVMSLYRDESFIEKFRFKSLVLRDAVILNENYLVVALNDEKKSKPSIIYLYAISKKLKFMLKIEQFSDILSMNAELDVLVICFVSKIMIYRMKNDALMLIAENHSLQFCRYICIKKMEYDLYIFVSDCTKRLSLLKYKFLSDEIEQLNCFDYNLKAIEYFNDNTWIGLTENNFLCVFTFIDNKLDIVFTINEIVHDFVFGTMNVFSKKALYFTMNNGSIKYLCEISDYLSNDDIELIIKIQEYLFRLENVFYDSLEYIHFDLLNNEVDDRILNDLNIEKSNFLRIVSTIDLIK